MGWSGAHIIDRKFLDRNPAAAGKSFPAFTEEGDILFRWVGMKDLAQQDEVVA